MPTEDTPALSSAGSFQFGSKDRGYVSLLLSCDCLTNGDDRHCIGSRSPRPDGTQGSVPGHSAAVTAEEVKPEWAQCPGSMDSPRLLSQEPAHSPSLSRPPVCLFLDLSSLHMFSCLLFLFSFFLTFKCATLLNEPASASDPEQITHTYHYHKDSD